MFILSFAIPSSVLQSFFFFSASSLFWTQHRFTHPPVKSSTRPLRKMHTFQGVAHRHTNFALSCAVPLWDSAIAGSPYGKELSPSHQGDARFSGRCTLSYAFCFILPHPSLGLSNSLLTLRYPQPFFSERIMFLTTYCCVMYSYCPAVALFGLVLTHIIH